MKISYDIHLFLSSLKELMIYILAKTVNCETVRLTDKESELLLLLSKNNHRIINRREILETLWGENDYFLGRSLDVFMSRLRKYFQKDQRIKFDSVRGIGFKIEFPDL